MSKQFGLLIEKLQDTISQPHEGAVNTKQCQVEAEIIGYLLGKKVAKRDEEYLPEGFDENSTLLGTLNLIAKKACIQLLSPTNVSETPDTHLTTQAELSRD